jgi:TolC family type I secretion outer membrane protein
MKSYMVKICLIILIFSAFFYPDYAFPSEKEDGQNLLSLSDAIKKALESNPRAKVASFQVDESDARITQARSGLLPQIYLNETYGRTTNPMWAFGTKLNQEKIAQSDFDPARLNDPDVINNFITSVTFDWTLFDGGQTWIGLKQAKSDSEASQLMLQRTREEIIAQTGMAYLGLLISEENLALIRQILETAGSHLKMARSRYENGFVVKSDLLRAQVRVSELEQELFAAESGLIIAKAMLCNAMGIPAGSSFGTSTRLEQGGEIEEPVEKWTQKALANRKDLKQLLTHESMAKEEVDKSLAGHLPSLHLVGNYEINSEDFSETADNYMVGAMMRLNLFSGERISGKTKEARASLKRIQSIRQELELGIDIQVRKAYYNALSSRKCIKTSQESVSQAEENLRIVRKRYENGLYTIVSLLDAEAALKQARTGYLKALHDYNAASIQLALAAGTINETLQ